jgi:transposase
MALSIWQVRDELWNAAEPTLPRHPRQTPKSGRPRVDDRTCFVLFTGTTWRHLPKEMGCSPATCAYVLSVGRSPASASGCIAGF